MRPSSTPAARKPVTSASTPATNPSSSTPAATTEPSSCSAPAAAETATPSVRAATETAAALAVTELVKYASPPSSATSAATEPSSCSAPAATETATSYFSAVTEPPSVTAVTKPSTSTDQVAREPSASASQTATRPSPDAPAVTKPSTSADQVAKEPSTSASQAETKLSPAAPAAMKPSTSATPAAGKLSTSASTAVTIVSSAAPAATYASSANTSSKDPSSTAPLPAVVSTVSPVRDQVTSSTSHDPDPESYAACVSDMDEISTPDLATLQSEAAWMLGISSPISPTDAAPSLMALPTAQSSTVPSATLSRQPSAILSAPPSGTRVSPARQLITVREALGDLPASDDDLWYDVPLQAHVSSPHPKWTSQSIRDAFLYSVQLLDEGKAVAAISYIDGVYHEVYRGATYGVRKALAAVAIYHLYSEVSFSEPRIYRGLFLTIAREASAEACTCDPQSLYLRYLHACSLYDAECYAQARQACIGALSLTTRQDPLKYVLPGSIIELFTANLIERIQYVRRSLQKIQTACNLAEHPRSEIWMRRSVRAQLRSARKTMRRNVKRENLSSVRGYFGVGRTRKIQYASISFWIRKSITAKELEEAAFELRSSMWEEMADAGIKYIPSNTFTYSDHVLDAIAMLGAVPARYVWNGLDVDTDTYFRLSYGTSSLPAMKKMSLTDTYIYTVPELGPAMKFKYASKKAVTEYLEAKKLGLQTTPALLGPVSFLLLADQGGGVSDTFSPLSLLGDVLEIYKAVLCDLKSVGASWVQFDEPTLVGDIVPEILTAFHKSYSYLSMSCSGLQFLLQIYFDDISLRTYKSIISMKSIAAIGFDLVTSGKTIQLIRNEGFPCHILLFAGVVNGNDVWATDLDFTLELLESLQSVIGKDKIVVTTSSYIQHVPIDLVSSLEKRYMDCNQGDSGSLAFSQRKLMEVYELAMALAGKKDIALFRLIPEEADESL